MTPDQKAICRVAVHHFGTDAQVDKAIEECLELALILQRLKQKDRPVAPVHIITEIADVAVMVEQLAIIYGPTAVSEQVELKLRRLAQKIEPPLGACRHTFICIDRCRDCGVYVGPQP